MASGFIETWGYTCNLRALISFFSMLSDAPSTHHLLFCSHPTASSVQKITRYSSLSRSVWSWNRKVDRGARVHGYEVFGNGVDCFLCASPFFAPLTVHHPVSTRYVGREIVVSVVSCPQSTTVAGFRDDAYTFNFWLRSG